jgi:hypothetical protein
MRRWAGLVAHVGNVCRILVGKPEEGSYLKELGVHWRITVAGI